jgi:hypothetical protein
MKLLKDCPPSLIKKYQHRMKLIGYLAKSRSEFITRFPIHHITRIICSALTGLRPSADSALSLFLLTQQERQSLRDR